MQGPYGKLWTEFFSFFLWLKRVARGPWKQGRKKRGSITCLTDRANEANRIFIIWLCWLFRFSKGDRELEVRTATYGPGIDQSQHANSVSHIIRLLNHNIHEKYNGRSVTGNKGSCLLCWMFGNSLEDLGKCNIKCKNKHSDKFPKFFKSFGKLRKSSEILGIFRKSSEVFKSFRKSLEKSENVAKWSRLPSSIFSFFMKSSEIF